MHMEMAFSDGAISGAAVSYTHLQIAFLFLTHNDPHHVEGQVALLAVLFQPLGLGK